MVEASGGTAVSAHGAWISDVHYPDPLTGQPAAEPAFSFQYTIDGLVAARSDARGMRFEHVYDELGRRIETHVEDAAWFVAPQCEQPDNRAVNRVSRLAYQYRPDGLLTGVTAFTRSAAYAEVADLPECTAEPPPGDEYVLADHLFEYDGFGNLTREVQSHGAPADENAPAISYEWDFAGASAGNRNRLARMIYPKPAPEGGGRELSFVYGEPGSVDEALDRVTKIDDDGWGELAKYTYMGLSRRVALMLAGVVTHSVAAGGAGVGYPGLDRFGRLTDLHYRLNAQDTIHRYQYGYDLAGNRTYARVTQAPTRALDGAGQPIEPPQWIPHVNDRSWLYAYDGLNRLIDAGLGALDDFNAGLLIGGTGLPGGGTAPVPGTTEWSLDNLGNWSGGELGGSGPPVSVLMSGDFDGDGTADDDRTLHHDVNRRNQITGLTEQGESGGPVVHDPAGNVVLHGEYYYQFDAFNRLVQVNLLGEAQVNAEDGRIVSGALGDLVAQYMYDGLGRLMAKRTPERLSSPKLQTKDYYYDGVRRVSEVITRHGVPPEPGRNDELKEREDEGEGGEEPPGLPPLPVVEQWTDREYVYGPDYVDEFLAQFDRAGRPMLMLQDGNFNVVALVAGAEDVFFDAGTNGLPAGSVLEQYVYDPYGGVRQADSFAEHAVNRVGHQGFTLPPWSRSLFDRFDGDWEHAGLAPGAVGLYYNRNRFYSPPSLRNVGDAEDPDWRLVGLGRFISADPNETALTLVSALAMNGQPLDSPNSSGFGLKGHYSEGFNLYQYLASNPANSRDPLGLMTFADLMGGSGGAVTIGATSASYAIRAFSSLQFLIGQIAAASYVRTVAALTIGASFTSAYDPSVWTALQGEFQRFYQFAAGNSHRADGFQQGLENLAHTGFDPFQKFERVYNSIREWEGWDPSFRKVDEVRDTVDPHMLRILHNTLPGRWQKVYMYGRDGRQIHCFRHASGKIVAPKWK